MTRYKSEVPVGERVLLLMLSLKTKSARLEMVCGSLRQSVKLKPREKNE